MLRTLLCLSLLSLQVYAAAPDTLADVVYREKFARASIRTATEKTIVFSPAGRFTFLKHATVSFVATQYGGRVLLQSPRGDGTYTYRKTGDTTATIDLRFDAGGSESMDLVFSTASRGTGDLRGAAFPDFTFSVTPLAASQAAPALNVSMRGRVAAGQPLVVGFVVPGSRESSGGILVESAGATARDVLIRAVGPSLSRFGVTNAWADPDFSVYEGSSRAAVQQFHYSDWSRIKYEVSTGPVTLPNTGGVAALRRIFDFVGAFPLVDDSTDAASVFRFAPGAYTIVAEPVAGDAGGEVLIEVYFLP